MEPTISSEGEYLLIAHFGNVCLNDIVVCKSPNATYHYICKRVKGMEGDIVEFRGSPFRIPRGHVWLEGDNSSQSFDSRNFGPVPIALLEGRIVLRFWPLSSFGRL